jgi:hypothetical protein
MYTEGGEARSLMMPHFSIVIPMFNRQAFIGRALQSCLNQTFADWEAVVVDDASSDASAEVVGGIGDPRVRLICHEKNLGVCPARNSGVRAARGKWIIFLDSDDELIAGSLQLIHVATMRAPGNIQRLVFSLRDDLGRISPEPPLASGVVWEYREYIEWLGRTERHTDFLNCIRRDVFDAVQWPGNRALEALFHFEVARRFRTQCHSDVVGLIHYDARNRSSATHPLDRLRAADDLAGAAIRLLADHGEALQAWAPNTFATFLRSAGVNSFMAGKRRRGAVYAAALFRRKPFAPTTWGVLLLSLFGRRTLAGAVALKQRLSGIGEGQRHEKRRLKES